MGLYSRTMLAFVATERAIPLMHNVVVPLDRALFKATRGRASLAHLGAAGRRSAMQNLLLTTTGRKSGKPRSSPVLFLDEDGGYVVVGSRYGTDSHPLWTANLLADPRATVLVRGREQAVVAERLSPEQLDRLWPRLLEIYPAWAAYRERTEREFRAFLLRPTSQEDRS